jgi:D-glycero-D-manno-heptose 1,7-bisphosphate phosphatase
MRPRRAPDELTAVFLDRDGVINRKAPVADYVRSWSEFAFLPGALDGLRLLGSLTVPLVVVTNQRGVALGHMSDEAVRAIHERMLAEVEAAGAHIDLALHCPHEVGQCDCRKPGVGMFERAAEHLPSIDLERSAMVGDSASDMEAAGRIGALRVLVAPVPSAAEADVVVPDLAAAAGELSRRFGGGGRAAAR